VPKILVAAFRFRRMRSNPSHENVPAPSGWLAVAFLGVWLYLISKLFEAYPSQVAFSVGATREETLAALKVTAGLGSILVLSGLVAALWRSNLAAGLSPSGVRGLVLGSAGIGVLVLFEVFLALDFFGVRLDPIGALLRGQPIGDILGTALAFAGLASLAVGLTQAAGLFERAPEPARAPSPPEKAA